MIARGWYSGATDQSVDRNSPAFSIQLSDSSGRITTFVQIAILQAHQKSRISLEVRQAHFQDVGEDVDEHELADGQHERQPRRLPADDERVERGVERDAEHEVEPDQDDPALVLGGERDDRRDDRGDDQDRPAGLHAAKDGGTHESGS